jgi:hypothetical protein
MGFSRAARTPAEPLPAMNTSGLSIRRSPVVLAAALAATGLFVQAEPSVRSGPVAHTADGALVLSVNGPGGVLSLLNPVTLEKVAEVAVGRSPMRVTTAGELACVWNTGSQDISVVSLPQRSVIRSIPARGLTDLAISPGGTRLYLADSGSEPGMLRVRALDPATGALVHATTAPHAGAPGGRLSVFKTSDAPLPANRVFFSYSYNYPAPGKSAAEEGQDDQREGGVEVFSADTLAHEGRVRLRAVADTGFLSNGRTAPANLGGSTPVSNVASTNPQTFTTPTGAAPNQPGAVAVHPVTGMGYVVSTAASPNGPLRFDTNHQGMVSVFDPGALTEWTAPQTDPGVVRSAPLVLNGPGLSEPLAPPALRISNPVAMEWRPDGSDAWFVNQNTNRLIRLTVNAAAVPTIGAPLVPGSSSIVQLNLEAAGAGRIPGLVPDGLAMNPAGTRLYVSCMISQSVTGVDISNPVAPFIFATAQITSPPAPGTRESLIQEGKRLFHTAGGRMSQSGWSSCSSCHPGGQSDGITWMFPDGPRQTPSLAGAFAKNNPADRRIFNWSATFDEVADFELHIRQVAGGQGCMDDDRVFHAVCGVTAGGDTGSMELFHQFTGNVSGTGAAGTPLPLLEARRDHACATLQDGRICLFGGRTGAGAGALITSPDALVVEFDPKTNTTRAGGSAGFLPRYSCSAGAIQTSTGPRIYVGGGYTSTAPGTLPTATVQEYNPATGTWRDVAPMPQGVGEAAACVAGGINSVEPLERMHVFSGNMGPENSPVLLNGGSPAYRLQVFVPDPAGPGTWTTANPAVTPRRLGGIAPVVKDTLTRIYVFGGIDGSGAFPAAVEEFGAQSFITLSGTRTPLPGGRARFGIAASLTDGQVYLAGGVNPAGTPLSDILEYSTTVNGPVPGGIGSPSGAWTVRGQLTTPRHSFALSSPPGLRPLLPHGNDGRSPDWEALRAYIATIAALPAPVWQDYPAAQRGRALFSQSGLVVVGFSCASCHGGPKWTRSTVDFSAPCSPDSNVGLGDERVIASELRQTMTQPTNGVLINVGTRETMAVNEMRQSPGDIRSNSFARGGSGYNIPSLLSVHSTAPYFHSGTAPTLEHVLNGSADSFGGTRHHFVPSAAQRADLIAFLRSIDDTTPPITLNSAAPAVILNHSRSDATGLWLLSLQGTANQVYSVEYSTDAVDWRTHRSYNAGPTGWFDVLDLGSPDHAGRQFVRIGVR